MSNQHEDALDAALDGRSNRSSSELTWLPIVSARLQELDGAFDCLQSMPNALVWSSLPDSRTHRQGRISTLLRSTRPATIAAAVALLMIGALAFAAEFNGWFQSPDHDSIPAAVLDRDDSFVPMTVTPSACTLPPLTREQYDRAMVGKTPIPEDDVERYVGTQTDEVIRALNPVVRDGAVVITGGQSLPSAMTLEISDLLASFLACLNQNDTLRLNGLLSDDWMPVIGDLDALFADAQATQTPEYPPAAYMQISQMRLLDDESVAVVFSVPPAEPELPAGFEPGPEPTPAGSVAIDGQVVIFVKTSDGWRPRYSVPGAAIRLPLPPAKVAATPVTATTDPQLEPIVVTPGHCVYSPTYVRDIELSLRANGVDLPASPQPVNESGHSAAQEALRDYYIALLDRALLDGHVIFTVGQPADATTAHAIALQLETFFGCLVDGKISVALQFFSLDLLTLMWAQMEPTVDTTPIPEDQAAAIRFELSQFRELPDGRVMAVYTSLISPEDAVEVFDVSIAATPTNTTAPTGVIMIFVNAGGEWRLDFQIGPDAFRMPLPGDAATPTAQPQSTP